MIENREEIICTLRDRIAQITQRTPLASDAESDAYGKQLVTEIYTQESTNNSVSSDIDEAYQRILRFSTAAERHTSQVRSRLLRAGYSSEVADAAIAKAVALGVIDDLRYAESLVRTRLRQGRGLSGIERELRDIGLSLEDIPNWQVEFAEELERDECERAKAYLIAHPPRAKNQRDAAYRKLIQRGFSSSSSSTAARMWIESLK